MEIVVVPYCLENVNKKKSLYMFNTGTTFPPKYFLRVVKSWMWNPQTQKAYCISLLLLLELSTWLAQDMRFSYRDGGHHCLGNGILLQLSLTLEIFFWDFTSLCRWPSIENRGCVLWMISRGHVMCICLILREARKRSVRHFSSFSIGRRSPDIWQEFR